ncbi:MAG: heparinase II/III family protein [Kiritimatiellae bacterium]|nr:heparinase II/III family protein [Kiritimatiellia bacterium]
MKKAVGVALWTGLLFLAAADGAVPPPVRPGHPRLWFTQADLPRLRARIASTHKGAWDALQQGAERDPTAQAFIYAMTGRQEAARAAIDSARRRAARLPEIRGARNAIDVSIRSHIETLAFVFDWCYPELSGADRHAIGNAILFGLTWQIENHFTGPKVTYVTGGHHEGHQTVALLAALALAGEPIEPARDYPYSIAEFYQVLYSNLEDGQWPVWRKLGAAGGGFHMSWMYSGGRFGRHTAAVAALTSATGVDYFGRERGWLAQMPAFLIYGIADATKMHRLIAGDQGWPRFQEWDYQTCVMLAGAFADPLAQWFCRRYEDLYAKHPMPATLCLYKTLWYEPEVPEGDPATLPRFRAFDGVGKYIMREGWAPDDLIVYFKNMPYFFENHNHGCNGHFTINYRGGRLAIDSGVYDRYGSEHHRQYYTRAVAHNTLLVGGNEIRAGWNTNPFTLEMARTAVCETTNSYTCIVADFSKSYEKAEEIKRHFVYLRNVADWECPVVFIFDRAVAVAPEVEKRWLLHSMDKPDVAGLLTVIREGNGALFVRTLEHARGRFAVSAVGSDTDINRQFLDWDYRSRLPVEAAIEKMVNDRLYSAGKWRIEVKPQTRQKQDYFLHVLAPASREVTAPPAIDLIESDELIGARINDRVVLWNAAGKALPAASFRIGQPGEHTVMVGGLAANSAYELALGPNPLKQRTTEGGILEFRFRQEQAGDWCRLRRP